MANEHALKLKTVFLATCGVKEYRATIPGLVRPDDVILEIGCEWGTTTTLIAPHCREVVGTDISPECVARARERYPELRFAVLDAFDVRAALALGRPLQPDLHRRVGPVGLPRAPHHVRHRLPPARDRH